jgi:hypothetical protein
MKNQMVRPLVETEVSHTFYEISSLRINIPHICWLSIKTTYLQIMNNNPILFYLKLLLCVHSLKFWKCVFKMESILLLSLHHIEI